MRNTATRSDALDKLVAALQSGVCDPAAARELYALGPDAVTLALLAAARRLSEQDARLTEQGARLTLLETQAQTPGGVSPSTPSGRRPVYTKPNVTAKRGQRRQRPGAKAGQPGHQRSTPTRIDERREQRLKVCPCCGGALQRGRRSRTRRMEDLPENLQSVVTEHTIHRDYGPQCKKHVAPVVPDALPNATFGHRLVRCASWCHYGLGVTLAQLLDILQDHLRTKLSAGGRSAAGPRLAEIRTPWYEQRAAEAKKSADLPADETGGRVPGQTGGLGCFAKGQVCYYLSDRRRGRAVWQQFCGAAFDGSRWHDCWAAYESLAVLARQ